MAEKLAGVLDFGSKKLSLLVGKEAVNHNLVVLASSEVDYAGFMDGEFLEPNQLKADIKKCLLEVNDILGKQITRLFVGVPAEFCLVTSRGLEKNFFKHTKITQDKVDDLFISMDKNIKSDTHSIINVSPLSYELDGTNRISNPEGAYAKILKAYACVVLAENKFLNLVNGILGELNVLDVEYICSPLAVATTLIPEEERSTGALILDVGYLTTSLAHTVGEGLFELDSFSIGGGQITAEISDWLDTSFSVAEQVKQQLLITLKPTGLDYYEVINNGKLERVPAKESNESAMRVVDEIIDKIKVLLDEKYDIEEYDTLYLTGGGLGYMKGIEFYMGRKLGRKVTIVSPKQPKFALPDLSSVVSLLDTALKMEDN